MVSKHVLLDYINELEEDFFSLSETVRAIEKEVSKLKKAIRPKAEKGKAGKERAS